MQIANGYRCYLKVDLAADFCSGGTWAIRVRLKFSFGLQLLFNEARPACILCFAIAENVFYQFPGSISKKNYARTNVCTWYAIAKTVATRVTLK
jgi:hypothetical protein